MLADQAPALFTEETSEAFWIHPGEGYRRFIAGEMQMAEPAEYGLGYLAQFSSLEELWTAHADGQAQVPWRGRSGARVLEGLRLEAESISCAKRSRNKAEFAFAIHKLCTFQALDLRLLAGRV